MSLRDLLPFPLGRRRPSLRPLLADIRETCMDTKTTLERLANDEAAHIMLTANIAQTLGTVLKNQSALAEALAKAGPAAQIDVETCNQVLASNETALQALQSTVQSLTVPAAHAPAPAAPASPDPAAPSSDAASGSTGAAQEDPPAAA